MRDGGGACDGEDDSFPCDLGTGLEIPEPDLRDDTDEGRVGV